MCLYICYLLFQTFHHSIQNVWTHSAVWPGSIALFCLLTKSVAEWLELLTKIHLPLTVMGSNLTRKFFILLILSCEEAINLADGMLLALFRCLLVPELMHREAPMSSSTSKSWKGHHMTFTVLVWHKKISYCVYHFMSKWMLSTELLSMMFTLLECYTK